MRTIRGAFHFHSREYSYDGKASLAEWVDCAKSLGLQFLLMAEHREELPDAQTDQFATDCAALSTDSFLLIPGIESRFGPIHLATIGSSILYDDSSPEALLAAAKENNCSTIWCHPPPGVVDSTQLPAWLQDIDFIEAWNTHSDSQHAFWNDRMKLWRAMREKYAHLYGIAGLDGHEVWELRPPYINAEISDFCWKALQEALHAGRYTIEHPRFPAGSAMEYTLAQRVAAGLLYRVYWLYAGLRDRFCPHGS